MKKLKKKKNKQVKKIKKAPVSVQDKEKQEIMQKAMDAWQEKQRREKEELESQTWPIWLIPQAFQDWYIAEQNLRKELNIAMLPPPPRNIIDQILDLDKKREEIEELAK